jgi:CBS domain-containing protein
MHLAPVSVNMADTVLRVEEVMNEHNLSSVPVIDPVRGDCFGIISLKDIRHFHETKKNPRVIRAWEMCSYKPSQVNPETLVEDAARLMVDQGIHHLVVSDRKVIKGFLSSLDVIASMLAKK